MEENNKDKKPKKIKKKFNYILLIQILGLVALAACLFETIYQVVCYKNADDWLVILCYIMAVILIVTFFKKQFIFDKKAIRNRILLYVGLLIILCIPNIVGEIILYTSAGYGDIPEVIKLVGNNGFSYASACAIRCFSDVLTIAFLDAILVFLVEMMLRENLKKLGDNND